MTTVSTTVERVRRLLFSGHREEINTLSAAITTTSATSFTLTNAVGGAIARSVVEIDQELIYIVTAAASTVSVCIRGWDGSTAATHLINAAVTVNPKFPRLGIIEAINEELDSLSGQGLFRPVTLNQTYNSSIQGYDLTGATAVEQILEVKYHEAGPTENWPVIGNRFYELKRDSLSTSFASTFALVLKKSAYPGRELRITYAAPFTAVSALTDTLETTAGLHTQAHDIVRYGAALRMAAGREIPRTFFEAMNAPNADAEVPAGAALNAPSRIERIYARRVREELTRLNQRYPHRMM